MSSKKPKGSRYTRPQRHRVTSLRQEFRLPDYDEHGQVVVPDGPGPIVYASSGLPFVFTEMEAAWIAERTGLDAGDVDRILELRVVQGLGPDGLPPAGSGMSFGLALGHFAQAARVGVDVDVARTVAEWHCRFLAEHDLAHRDAEGEWVSAAVMRVKYA